MTETYSKALAAYDVAFAEFKAVRDALLAAHAPRLGSVMKVTFVVGAAGVYVTSVGDGYAMDALVSSVENAAEDLRASAAEERENAARLITRAERKEAVAAVIEGEAQ